VELLLELLAEPLVEQKLGLLVELLVELLLELLAELLLEQKLGLLVEPLAELLLELLAELLAELLLEQKDDALGGIEGEVTVFFCINFAANADTFSDPISCSGLISIFLETINLSIQIFLIFSLYCLVNNFGN